MKPLGLLFRSFIGLLALTLLSALSSPAFGATTLWIEDFDAVDWPTRWHTDQGTWEVGIPSVVGPAIAHSGQNCAATVIAGNYSEGVDSRFVRHASFVVPAASENPRLRFWHWFSFHCSDYGRVQIRPDGGTWEDISEKYSWYSSGAWTRPHLDLTAYAGESVEVAFYFHSENNGSSSCGYGSADVDAGWYVDDVTVETGPVVLPDLEDWEQGLGDWGVSRGTWEVGVPTSGPASCHSGTECAGTRLDGNYYEAVDTRLTSPPFTVPAASENPRLRFWHWFSYHCSDFGKVQILPDGGTWEDISTQYSWYSSNVWSRVYLDLTAYAGQTVQVAFYLHTENNGSSSCGYGSWDTDAGWFVDDMTIETGVPIMLNPEDWELGLGDWGVSRGTWEVGDPTSGPGSCYSESKCAATRLGGNYYENVDSYLMSPPFFIPEGGDQPALRFQHWYNFNCSDYGEVRIKPVGDDTWYGLDQYTGTSSGVWTSPHLELIDYSGQTVQVAFFFHSRNNSSSSCGYGSPDVAPGWFVDDVQLTGFPCVDNDGDGYGDLANPNCRYPSWDCDDSDPDINPGFVEAPLSDPVCSDLLDNDCDRRIDSQDGGCCECVDNDGDGYGDPACPDCEYPEWDCDDSDPTKNLDCPIWPADNAAAAASFGADAQTTKASSLFNNFVFLMMPVGAVICMKMLRRRKK